MAMFTGVTNASPKAARRYMKMAKGNVQRALDLFFELGGADHDNAAPLGRDACPGNTGGDEPPLRASHTTRLIDRLLSAAVQVYLPAEAQEEQARLSSVEVAEVFARHVPAVQTFLYRGTPGQFSLPFIQDAYRDGLAAFRGTGMQNHLTWLFRLIVHYGSADKLGASRYLQDVAEAFMDCQAVQGRVIERVGLEIRGVRDDFKGLVTRLIGDYKSMAIKMLAADRIRKLGLRDDGNPTHYENRLIADLGARVGLNSDDMRRAALDQHAEQRFEAVRGKELCQVVDRFTQLFDFDALLKALIAEVTSFSAESPLDSMPRLFFDWASDTLTEKHVVLDETTCTRVEIDEPFAFAMLESLFLGKPTALPDQTFRGHKLCELFRPNEMVQASDIGKACTSARPDVLTEAKNRGKKAAKTHRKCDEKSAKKRRRSAREPTE